MSEFTREEKLAMIKDYQEKNMSQKAICDKYGIAASTLRETLQRYRDGGAENVGVGKGSPGKKQNQYPGELKLAIVKERIAQGIGYREIARRYNINHNVVMHWERVYLQNGEQALVEEQRGKQVRGMSEQRSPKKAK